MSSDTVEITVLPQPEPTITITPPSPISGMVGEGKVLTALWVPSDPSDGYEAHWSVTPSGIVELDPLVGDVITAMFLATGTAHVTATPVKVEAPPVDPPVDLTAWETAFIVHEQKHHDFWMSQPQPLDGNLSALCNYYDLAFAYYKLADRFGSEDYRLKGDYYCRSQLHGYFKPNNYGIPPRGGNVESLPEYYLRTGDLDAPDAAKAIADLFYGFFPYGDHMEGRMAARFLIAQLVARQMLPAAEPVYSTRATEIVEYILGWQRSDGSFRFEGACGGQLSYMTGMIHWALIRYYREVYPDPRIVTCVETSARWLMATEYWPVLHPEDPRAVFRYTDGNCATTGDLDSGFVPADSPGTDLNGFFVPAFNWSEMPADVRAMAPALIEGTFRHGWLNGYSLSGSKQWTQFMRTSDGLYW